MTARVLWALTACPLVPALLFAPARAAFDLRDASPAALGAASMDLRAEPMFPSAGAGGWRLAASHASLYSVEGLTAEQAAAGLAVGAIGVELSVAQVGLPGARELTTRLDLSETRERPVSLSVSIERLSFAVDGERGLAGWALGGGVAAHIPLGSARLEIGLSGDRLLSSDALDALGVRSSLPISIQLHVGDASAAWVDRWESDGRRSPRLLLNLPLGGIARVRLAHGDAPGRTGAAFALRWRLLEVSVGRQDDSAGGSVSSFALVLRPAERTRSRNGSPKP